MTQNRSATFNGFGQLVATASPEKGAMSFGYNADYSLDYTIDAKNQKISATFTMIISG